MLGKQFLYLRTLYFCIHKSVLYWLYCACCACVWHTVCAVQAVSATPAVTPRSPTPPLASGKSFLFPTLGKQIIGSSRMTRSQSTSTHFYLLWKPFNRIPKAINHWICFIPHFALLVIHISFKYFIRKYLVSKSSVFLFHLHNFQCVATPSNLY